MNVHSRVQMYLFKARLAAQKEYTDLLAHLGVTEDQVKDFFQRHPRFASPLRRSPHGAAGTPATAWPRVAGHIGKAPWQIRLAEARGGRRPGGGGGERDPGLGAKMKTRLVERGPSLMAQAREEWEVARPLVAEAVKKTARDDLQKARKRFAGRSGAAAARPAYQTPPRTRAARTRSLFALAPRSGERGRGEGRPRRLIQFAPTSRRDRGAGDHP